MALSVVDRSTTSLWYINNYPAMMLWASWGDACNVLTAAGLVVYAPWLVGRGGCWQMLHLFRWLPMIA